MSGGMVRPVGVPEAGVVRPAPSGIRKQPHPGDILAILITANHGTNSDGGSHR